MLNTIVRTALLALGLTIVAPAAHAQAPSDEVVLDYLKQMYSGFDVIDYKRVYEGGLNALKDIVVISYSIDYPHATETPKTSEVEVLAMEGDRLKVIPMMPLPPGQVEKVSVNDGKLVIDTRTFHETDKPCCPTEPHSFVFTEADGVLAAAGK